MVVQLHDVHQVQTLVDAVELVGVFVLVLVAVVITGPGRREGRRRVVVVGRV